MKENTELERIHRIVTDPDYIALKRFKNSARELHQAYPEGAPDHLIAQSLEISEEEVEPVYEHIREKLKTILDQE